MVRLYGFDDVWDMPLFMQGSAHCVSNDEPDEDPAELVRQVAEEVTGQPLTVSKPRMGFLP